MIEKIIATVSEALGVPVTEATTQLNCEQWDSLSHLNIVIAIEDVFEVSFEPEEFTRMNTIKDIEALLTSKKH